MEILNHAFFSFKVYTLSVIKGERMRTCLALDGAKTTTHYTTKLCHKRHDFLPPGEVPPEGKAPCNGTSLVDKSITCYTLIMEFLRVFGGGHFGICMEYTKEWDERC